MRSDLLKYAAALSAAVGCIQTAYAQKIKAVPDANSAHILSVKVARDLPEGDLAEKIEKDGRGKSTLAESPDKIRQAFVFCVPSGSKDVPSCVQRVFVTDLGTDETYEVTGEEHFIGEVECGTLDLGRSTVTLPHSRAGRGLGSVAVRRTWRHLARGAGPGRRPARRYRFPGSPV